MSNPKKKENGVSSKQIKTIWNNFLGQEDRFLFFKHRKTVIIRKQKVRYLKQV